MRPATCSTSSSACCWKLPTPRKMPRKDDLEALRAQIAVARLVVQGSRRAFGDARARATDAFASGEHIMMSIGSVVVGGGADGQLLAAAAQPRWRGLRARGPRRLSAADRMPRAPNADARRERRRATRPAAIATSGSTKRARRRSKKGAGSARSSGSPSWRRPRAARTDAAMYWNAYALDKLGQKAEALAAAAELIKGYPDEQVDQRREGARAAGAAERRTAGASRGRGRRRAEAARAAGAAALRSRAGGADAREDSAGPAVAAPEGARAVRARAEQLAARAAGAGQRRRGAATPTCSAAPFSISASTAARENRELLAQIYESSTDVDIKRRILRSFGVSGDRARVLAAATSENVAGAARRSRAAARRHGRARRAVAALSEGDRRSTSRSASSRRCSSAATPRA